MLGPGSTLAQDRFVLEAEAGAGGMGVVWRALDRSSGAPVAIKILLATAYAERGRFDAEASALAHLVHPGIVRYVAHGYSDDRQPFLAMEWIEGETLGKRLERAPLSLPETLALGRRVAAALGLAHDRGVIHRDVKPDNLLLPGGSVADVKIADFGIARFEGRVRATQTGAVLGTPGYMSPEQARGSIGVDARADVFSLGSVLYECLTGRRAFDGEHPLAVLAKLVLEDPPRVRDFVSPVPAALDELVYRMMSKDPLLRPANGRALEAALDALGRLDVTLVRPLQPHVPSITPAEQRLMSVVLARPPSPLETGATLLSDTFAQTPSGSDVRSIVVAHGGHAEWLADGSLVATISGSHAATDQAARAAGMALAMASVLADWSLSLATGRALRTGRWPVGEAVDAAAHILGGHRVVHIDDLTANLLDESFEIAGEPGRLELRGRREPVPDARLLLGKSTPCVGRDRELRLIQTVFEESVEESVSRVVVVTGPAGIGKSRLRYEILRSVADRAEVVLARGDVLQAGAPYGMLAPALRRSCGVLGNEPVEAQVSKVRARVSRHVEPGAVDRVSCFLGELMGASFPDEGDVQLRAARQDARLMGDQMRRAFEDWLVAETSARPVVLVLEDLQWGDASTVRLVDAALRVLRDAPLTILALGRPEVHTAFPNLWSGAGAVEVRLGELTKRAAERLVRAVLGDDVGAERLTRILQRYAGNAFYLEELIRAEAQGGNTTDAPGTVLAMVQARLEATPPGQRRVLRAGSVLGQAFWRDAVVALLGETEPSGVIATLGELVDAELVTSRAQSRFEGQQEYAFRHDLVREAAYGMLTDEDRAVGHRLAAEWLERLGETDAWTLAEHFERSVEPARAAPYCLTAARQALARNDFDAALARAERGVEAAGASDPWGGLRLVQAEALRWRGDNAGALARALEAIPALARGQDSWFAAWAEVAMAAGNLGDTARLAACVDALGAADVADCRSSTALIGRARVAAELVFAGEYGRADPLLAAVEREAAPLAATEPVLAARVSWIRALRGLVDGDMATYLREALDALRSFDCAGDLRSSCGARGVAGWAWTQLGDHEQAERVLREAVAISDRLGLQQASATSRHNLGLALARRGAIEEALAVETEAILAFRTQGDKRFEGAARNYLGEILMTAGRHADAERELRSAVELLESFGPLRAFAIANVGRVLLEQDRSAEALAAAEEATALLETLGGVEEGEATIRLVHAEALAAAGRTDDARAAIVAARDRLLERAARIVDPTAEARFLQKVPENARTLERAAAWAS